ncbi:MAG: tripartite tricarboxylate transporter substrate binding protein [Acidobacteria bacterium]|nr:tripartite tricarboxylate transporter substrate binding protein [Acidobacteriota bacterium]
MLRLGRVFILVLGLALVAAACGDSESDTTVAATAAPTTVATTAAPTTAAPTTAAPVAFAPDSPECVAPSDPGGGWDFTCRTIGQLFEDQGSTGNVIVTNQPGGGGAVAFADIAANRNDDSDLVIAASPATAIRFGQNQYTGLEADDFRWIGAIGADFGVVAVLPDAPWETLDELVAAVQADPTSIVFGGGSPQGGQDHFKVLIFMEEIGVDPAEVPWVAYDGGGEAQVALLGGEIEVFTGDVSETFASAADGEIRILAVMGEDRIDGMDAPTTIELGYTTIFPIWRGLLAPGGMSDEAYDFWVDALGEVEASDAWAVERENNGLLPLRLLGADFEAFALDAVNSFRVLSEPFGLVAP